jgi:basic amino acid/polyamine antiporter, APA family
VTDGGRQFVRQSTGLVRDFNWFDGLILNMSYINVAGVATFWYAFGTYLFPGADMSIAFSVVLLLGSLPVVVAYSFLAGAMPRSGGDYVFVTRSLGGSIGFAVALVFVVYLCLFSAGFNAWFLATGALAPTLAAIGYASSNPGLVTLSTTIGHPLDAIAIGLVALAMAFVFLVVTPRILHRILLVLFVIAFLGYPVLYDAILAVSTNAQFVSAFNNYATSAALNTSYSGMIDGAAKLGATLVPLGIVATLATLPVAQSNPQSSTYIGGEMKRPTRSLPMSLILTLFVVAIVFYVTGFLTYRVFGYNFLSATAYYAFSGAANPLPVAPYTNFFLSILVPNQAIDWFIFLSVAAWGFLIILSFILMATRALFSMSFDRVIPTAFSSVSQRFHTPTNATALILLASIIFMVSYAYSLVSSAVNTAVGFTSAYVIVMIACMLFPFRRKDLFASSPAFVTKKLGSLPVMTLVGIIGFIPLSIVFYFLLTLPSVSGVTPTAVYVVIAFYLVALVLFYALKTYRARHGIDLSLVYREIPPE